MYFCQFELCEKREDPWLNLLPRLVEVKLGYSIYTRRHCGYRNRPLHRPMIRVNGQRGPKTFISDPDHSYPILLEIGQMAASPMPTRTNFAEKSY